MRSKNLRGFLAALTFGIGGMLAMAASPPARASGAITSWGANTSSVVSGTPAGVFKAVDAGDNFCVAIKTDNTLYTWGSDGANQVTNTPSTGAYIAVGAGAEPAGAYAMGAGMGLAALIQLRKRRNG